VALARCGRRQAEPSVTVQRSQILRAFARGQSITRIAESFGIEHSQAWSQLKRAVAELERKGGTAHEIIRFQQFFVLSRVVDEAMQAWVRSQDGVKEFTSKTNESRDRAGNLTLTSRTVTHHVRKDAGDVRYLETAMVALKEIRDLWSIGADAESN
jgi:hypothetical protein